MAAYKKLNEKDYELILALANHGMKCETAAKAIGMSRNSAYCREDKIYRITGLDPRNFYDLQKLVDQAHKDNLMKIAIKPDGVHELSAHAFELEQRLANCTVKILRCKCCGHVSIGWYRQEDTEEIHEE